MCFNGATEWWNWGDAADAVCPAKPEVFIVWPFTEKGSQPLLWISSGHTLPAALSFSDSWLGCLSPATSCLVKQTHFTQLGFLRWPWICFCCSWGYSTSLWLCSAFFFLLLSFLPGTLYPYFSQFQEWEPGVWSVAHLWQTHGRRVGSYRVFAPAQCSLQF